MVVRGELDWIVMKALEKDRQRRYETANGLGMDIRRYLSGEAVVAAPPGAGYRLRKFVRRNTLLPPMEHPTTIVPPEWRASHPNWNLSTRPTRRSR
jgi:hypothetical protein